MTPFKIHIDDSILEDLRVRLDRTRFPDQLDGVGWDYGTDLDYLKELVHYWRTDYDWREQERKLNEFSQFTTEISVAAPNNRPHATSGDFAIQPVFAVTTGMRNLS